MPVKKSLVGKTFKRLLVLREGPKVYYKSAPWGIPTSDCRCKCGVELNVLNIHLKSGHTQSCGCWQREATSQSRTTHGQCRYYRRSRAYKSWCHMIGRCNNPTDSSYERYGKAGRNVCARWHKYENFFSDMGECPPGLTIERINNKKGYYPENCCWASRKEQSRNTSRNRIITVNGVTGCLSELCEMFHKNYWSTYHRIFRKGWPVNRAFA